MQKKKQIEKEEIANLAKKLASRFGLRLSDAKIIVLLFIMEKNDEVLIKSTIEARAAEILNIDDRKKVSDLVSRILDVIPLSSSLHLPPEGPRLQNLRKEEKPDETISSSFSLFQTSYNALKIMQIAIEERKALYLKAENVIAQYGEQLIKYVFEENGIGCVIVKSNSLDDEYYVSEVLKASWNGKIVLLDLVNTIFRKKNDNLIPDLLDNVERKRKINDKRKAEEVLSKTYSTSFISSRPESAMIENMLCCAQREKRALKLLFSGESGTGKTSFAYTLAQIAGMKVISKCPEDIMFRYW